MKSTTTTTTIMKNFNLSIPAINGNNKPWLKHLRFISVLILTLLTITLTACSSGGGGGGSPTPKTPEAPAVPSISNVGSATTTSLNVSWDPVANATYYQVYRDNSTRPLPGNIVETYYIDTDLTPNTFYSYKLTACNSDDVCSAQSATVSGRTLMAAPAPTPDVPTISNVGSATGTRLTVSWGPVAGATYYQVYRGDTKIGENILVPATSYTDTDLVINTTYSYRVDACNSDGRCSDKSEAVSGTTTEPLPAPDVPAISVGRATGNTLTISWNPVANAAYYQVYRDNSTRPLPGNIVGTYYVDTDLVINTTYSYRVEACNLDKACSDKSEAVSGTTRAEPLPTPAVPSISNVGSATTTSLNVSWDLVANATYYQVYRGNSTRPLPGNIVGTYYIDTDLTPNTFYSYKLTACTDECSAQSTAVSNRTLMAAPGVVPSVRVGDATNTALTVSWDLVAGATYYQVYRIGTSDSIGNVQATNYIDTNLTPNTAYSYRVEACNSDNECTTSATVSGRTRAELLPAPAVPTISNVGSATTTSLTVSWGPVANATYYQVYRDGTRIGRDIQATYYIDTDLVINTTYSYRVEACNSDRVCSAQSEAVSGRTRAEALPAPAVPTISNVGSATTTSLTVSWDQVPNATYYQVYRDNTPLPGNIVGTSYIDSDLTPNTFYSYKLTACTDECSALSTAVSGMTLMAAPAPAPDVPTISVRNPTGTSLTVSWGPVANATYYQVYRIGTSDSIGNVQDPMTNYIDTDLTPNTTYSYRVTACNSDRVCSALSTAVSGMTLMAAPAPAVPTISNVGSATTTSLNVSWDQVPNATYYQVYRNGTSDSIGNVQDPMTYYIDTNLTHNTFYSYKLTACNSDRVCSAQSDAVSNRTLMAAPGVPTISNVGSATTTSLTISWGSIVNATYYQVYRDNSTRPLTGSIATNSYTDTDLVINTTYSYRVVACNSDRVCSAQSAEVNGTTRAEALPAPAVPTISNVGSATTTSLTVSWNPVANATYYQVYRNGASDSIGNVQDPMTSYTDTNLTPNTFYSYKLTACNSDRVCSLQSAAVSGRTLMAAPGVPTISNVGSATGTRLTVSWDLVAGATYYQVYRDNSTRPLTGSIATNSYIDTDLVINTTYSYRVDACNLDNVCSDKSDPVNGTTRAELLPAPAVPSITNVSTGGAPDISLTVSWNPVINATYYRVYRNGTRTGGDIQATNYTDIELNFGTPYGYRVDACNSDDECSAQSVEVSGRTRMAAPAPAMPTITNVSTGGAPDISLTVSWNPVINATYYRVYRNGANIGKNVQDPATNYTDTDTNLVINTTYGYRVDACNFDNACSAKSAIVNGMTRMAAPAPAVPTITNVSTGGAPDISLTVSWNLVTDATYYEVSRNGAFQSNSTVAFYDDMDLDLSTSYNYTLTACNSDMVCSLKSAIVNGTTRMAAPAPAVPSISNVAMGGAPDISLTVSWDSVINATYYRVYRNGTRIGGDILVPLTSYADTDTDLVINTNYGYRVTACSEQCSAQSAEVSGRTRAAAPAPAVPTISNVGSATTTSLNVSWDSVINATYYQVYRDNSTRPLPGNINTTSYIDSNLTHNTYYNYTLAACNSDDQCSRPSEIVSNRTLMAAPVVPTITSVAIGDTSNSSLNISWDLVTDATYYEVYRNGKFQDNSTVAFYVDDDMDLGLNITYNYTLTACNRDRVCSLQSAIVSGTTRAAAPAPAVPSITSVAMEGASGTSLMVSWGPVAGATYYQVYRNGTKIEGDILVPLTSYTDTGLNFGTNYGYRVTACSEQCSAQSAEVSGMTRAAAPAPAVPSISVGSATHFSLTVSWDSVINATYYKIFIDANNKSLDEDIKATSYTRELTSHAANPTSGNFNQTRSFRVTACNIDRVCSAKSESASGTTLPSPINNVFDVNASATDDDYELNGTYGITTTIAGNSTYVLAASQVDNSLSVFRANADGSLNLTNTILDSDDAAYELEGASELETITLGSDVFVYVTGLDDDGITSFKLADDGTLSGGFGYPNNSSVRLDGANGITSAVVGGTNTYLFVVAEVDNAINVFNVTTQGDSKGRLTHVTSVVDSDASSYELDGAAGVETAVIDGKTYLFVTGFDDNGLSVFEVQNNGALMHRTSVTDGSGGNDLLGGAAGLTTTTIGTNTYLFVTAKTDDAVTAFRVNTAADGLSLTLVDTQEDNEHLNGASRVETRRVGDFTYLFVSSFITGSANVTNPDEKNTGGLSVFLVNDDGSLEQRLFTELETLDINLAGVLGITIAEVDGTPYLFVAAFNDDGISVFEIR